MAFEIIRILSDLHFGDPASRLVALPALQPLFAGADRIVFNGDSIDTRVSPTGRTASDTRRQFLEFVQREAPRASLLTGNHDGDISATHHLDLLGGVVFVTHGEVLFPNLVPWGHDQPLLENLYREELGSLSPAELDSLEPRLAAAKRACVRLPLPDDPYPRSVWEHSRRAAAKFWPPSCAVAMVRAWGRTPSLAAAFARRHRPGSRFFVLGHTHLPGVWYRGNMIIINTGSLCPPFGSYAVDVSPPELVVRRIRRGSDGFSLGRVVASFALAPAGEGPAPSGASLPELAPVP